ncbi:MAG: glycosyltransferase [Actinomycetota bacterium]|nr:glycosyltransferase [Actinomycetota bacterium]
MSILPLALRRVGAVTVPVVLNPRGELSRGALQFSAARKRAYLISAKWLGLYRGILWHVGNSAEAAEVRTFAGADARVEIAPNLGPVALPARPNRPEPKRSGQLRLVFVSRISPKKNLLGALGALKDLHGEVRFDIYGPIEDAVYWRRCLQAARSLPRNIQTRHRGTLSHEAVVPTLAQYDALLFPTFGENFGHVIAEALLGGCPVIVSDRTPWAGLEAAGAGWNVSLRHPENLLAVLTNCMAMDSQEHAQWSAGARVHAERVLRDPAAVGSTKKVFARALSIT